MGSGDDTDKDDTVDVDSSKLRSEEMELMRTKNDMIIEDAEVISYILMIKTAEQLGMRDDAADIISPLKQTLQEEERMAKWPMDNSDSILDYHWSRIKEASSLTTEEEEEEARKEKSSSSESAATTTA